jgi:pyridoxal phosphate enzyme (YggS family)
MYGARLREALPRVEERIARALDRSGRSGDVTLVAVTKGHGPDAVRAAAEAGIRDCGENRAAELVRKRAELGSPVRWHLIGHLQRNKVRSVLGQFDLIQSVDSIRLARELSSEAERAGLDIEALVQVNASGEDTKGGFDVDAALDAIAEVAMMPRLHVRGLMTMAPFTEDEAVLRRTFQRTRALFDACGRGVPGFTARDLSMGMSNDFDMAVEEGSTMVRLGTVLFGERTP